MWAPSPGNAEGAPSFWESDNPVVCLAIDLITASQGVTVAQQREVLVAEFLSFQAAIFAARRLQWAVQGFSEGGDQEAPSIAVLIHTQEDAPAQTVGGDLAHSLAKATAGQILLTEKASQPFENIAGFPLLAAPGKGMRELLWRAPESQSTRAADEEILARLVELHGVQELPPEPPQSAADEALDAAGSGDLDQQYSSPPRGKSRRVMVAVALGVLLPAAVLFYLFHGRSTPATGQDQAPDQTQTQAQTQTAPSNAPVAQPGQPPAAQPQQSPGAGKTVPPETTKAPKNTPKAAVKPPEQSAPEKPPAPVEKPPAPRVVEAPPTKGGRCELDPNQIPGQVAQASKKLALGKYADAQRQFSAVLACDPNNAAARQGLERARLAAQQADGGSDN
jgi:cytoskeletal protein RodZ